MSEPRHEGVAAVRRFNRFYTQKIGVLEEGLLRSPFSLTEVRVLFEIAHGGGPAPSTIAARLALDPGYLSRILSAFLRQKLIRRTASGADRRKAHLHLTAKGRRTFDRLDAHSSRQVAAMLSPLPPPDHHRLLASMHTIETLLGGRPEEGVPYILRPPYPGEMGWIVQRHGALYAEEHGYNQEFEGLVAGIVHDLVRRFDPQRERCWIAEREGQPVGSVALVKKSKRVAQLRLLLVEPAARGLGIGQRLVDECLRFARQAGYRKIVLWTHASLDAARRIYLAAGFKLVREEKSNAFGRDLVDQFWERDEG